MVKLSMQWRTTCSDVARGGCINCRPFLRTTFQKCIPGGGGGGGMSLYNGNYSVWAFVINTMEHIYVYMCRHIYIYVCSIYIYIYTLQLMHARYLYFHLYP